MVNNWRLVEKRFITVVVEHLLHFRLVGD